MLSTQKIRVPEDHEGLQVLKPNEDPIPLESHEQLLSGRRSSVTKTAADYDATAPVQEAATPRTLRKRSWLLLASALVVLCVGIAIGIGIGYKVGEDSKNSCNLSPAQESQLTNSTGLTGGQSVVTSGTTGITALECEASGPAQFTTNTSNPTNFTEQCYTDYPAGTLIYNTTTNQTNVDLDRITVYTFQSCMDACAIYNQGQLNSTQQCHAVTYVANLTYIIQAEGGNCFFKPHRGVPINLNPAANYSLYASAYMTDL